MAILKVSSQNDLDAAVRSVRSGDTIALSAGTYDGFTMNKMDFAQKVTITSADPGKPATINEFMIRGGSNVEIKNVKLDYNPAKSGDNPFWIEGSDHITITNVEIEGQIKGQYGSGVGLRIKNSDDVTLSNSDLSDFRNGLYASNSSDVKILNNDIERMSNDGMLFGGMTRVLIQGNDIRNMHSDPKLKHKDGIQFLTSSGEAGSKDVVIRGNVIVNDEITHGIFLTNSQYVSGKGGVFHSDVLIEDNVLQTNHVHGISVNHGNGITIRDNDVMPIKGGSNIPLINVSKYSVDVRIQNNDVTSVQDPQNGSWTVTGNQTIRDRLHWYGDAGSPNVLAGKSDGNFTVAVAKAAPAPAAAPEVQAAPAVETAGEAVAGGGTGGQTGGQTLGGVKNGGGELFQVGGRLLDDGVRLLVEDVDFSGGDVIVFTNLDSATFRDERGGNPVVVWKDGSGARLDSAIDLREVVESSPDLTARAQGDQLILEIAQGSDVSEVVFDGLAADYFRVDPDLF